MDSSEGSNVIRDGCLETHNVECRKRRTAVCEGCFNSDLEKGGY
jgi:hypothetical protein